MTLTDEEARRIINALVCDCCQPDYNDPEPCSLCQSAGVTPENAPLVAMLESRIGTEDDLTTAYMVGFEKGKDAARKERRI